MVFNATFNGRNRMVVGCSWMYNYLCKQCLSPLMLGVRILIRVRCTQYNIVWSSLSATSDRSVVFSGYSTNKTLPRHNWNIVYFSYVVAVSCLMPLSTIFQLCRGSQLFDATFNNISVMSWQSVVWCHFQQYFSYVVAVKFRIERVITDKLYHTMLYREHPTMSRIRTRNFSGDRHWLHSCRANYHTIMTDQWFSLATPTIKLTATT
jgi:hypothetical protein